MKRRVGVGVVVLVVIAVVIWWLHGSAGPSSSPNTLRAVPRAIGSAAAARRPVDPRTQQRGSISGTVRNKAGAPIAGATVCTDLDSQRLPGSILRTPLCSHTDAQGHYQLANLLAAKYAVHAAAKSYVFETYYPPGHHGDASAAFPLAAGEARTGIDFVLARGGVEVTGVVLDITGGPIAHAQVRGSGSAQYYWGPVVEADEQGRFSLWLDRGEIEVHASADGYAASEARCRAPCTVEILLTPESSLAGTVVDPHGQPVEGARVLATGLDSRNDEDADITDADGKFRIDRLSPGRFTTSATTDSGYGRSEGSTLVGLGQHVDGVVIKLFPAIQVSGQILIGDGKEVCLAGGVELIDKERNRTLSTQREGDYQIARGVLPGEYRITVFCRGYLAHDDYDPIRVGSADVTGVIWRVDAGAKIHGRLLTRTGEALDGVDVFASTVGGAARAKSSWANDTSAADGSFELAGLKAGTQRVNVRTDRAIAPRDGFTVSLTAGANLEHDFVLDDGGKVTGSVVDDTGAPVANVEIVAVAADQSSTWWPGSTVKSAADGSFTIEALRAGDYRITARRGWRDTLRKPGTTDDVKQGERVTIRAGRTQTVRIVVESQHGTIRGSVVDAAGQPVADAFVSSARESTAAGAQSSSVAETRWWSDQRPVVTTTDGTFTLTGLGPGTYTVRAYRKGGGEAVAEHVAVGATAQLQIKPTGSIDGTARRDGSPLQNLSVTVRDLKTGFRRTEWFYMTGGHFIVRDLPAGHFDIDVDGDGNRKSTTVDLADGETRTGVDVTLDPLLTVTGRIVDYTTHQPVAGMSLYTKSARTNSFVFSASDDDNSNISDETGRFTMRGVPPGEIVFMGFPRDFQASDYRQFAIVRTVSGSGTVDIGDLAILKQRVKPDDPVGELGLHFADQPPDTPPAQRELKISWIDPTGPAARTELQLGDVITSCDGVDVSGANWQQWSAISHASPGTTLTLATKRGPTVAVVLAQP